MLVESKVHRTKVVNRERAQISDFLAEIPLKSEHFAPDLLQSRKQNFENLSVKLMLYFIDNLPMVHT